MFKLTVEQILASIEALSVDEQEELKSKLSDLLAVPGSGRGQATVQTQTFSVGRDFQIQGEGVTADFSQTLTAGETGGNQLHDSAATAQDLQAISTAITELKRAIESSSELHPVEKRTAAVPLETLIKELQQSEPDKGLIDRAIATLKKGLEGVQTLAEPVMNVSSLVAKAWFVL